MIVPLLGKERTFQIFQLMVLPFIYSLFILFIQFHILVFETKFIGFRLWDIIYFLSCNLVVDSVEGICFLYFYFEMSTGPFFRGLYCSRKASIAFFSSGQTVHCFEVLLTGSVLLTFHVNFGAFQVTFLRNISVNSFKTYHTVAQKTR